VAGQHIEIVEGPQSGLQVPLDVPVEVGRADSAQLVLASDDQVSRRHARISPDAHGAVVEDLGSRNGTFVNGQQIFSPTRLGAGDQLVVGVTVLELRTPAEVAAGLSGVRPVPPGFRVPERPPDYISPAAAVTGERLVPELDPLLDVNVKGKAKLAPLAIFVLVVLVVLIYLAQR
jgi:pSer/pThr/pTyr-binding forkhead associated (FHA) protein